MTARRARESALPDLEEVLDHLEDILAGAKLSREATEPVPGVDADLVEEIRCLLGTQRVPPALRQVSRDVLIQWITELRRAIDGETVET